MKNHQLCEISAWCSQLTNLASDNFLLVHLNPIHILIFKIVTLIDFSNLSKAITIPNIQVLGHGILHRSFSPSLKFIKMFEENFVYSNLIHANLCLIKWRLQFLNISYSFGDMSFWASQIIVWSSVYEMSNKWPI